MKNLILLITSIFMLESVNAGRLQNVDFMTEAELDAAGSSKAALLNDDKIYVNAISKTLDQAILDGDIGGGTELTLKGNLIGFGSATEECVLDKTDDKILTVDSTATCGFDFKDAPVSLPDQTGEVGKTLTTNGTDANWSIAEKLNAQVKDNLFINPSYENEGGLGVLNIITGVDTSSVATRTLQASTHNASQFQIQATGAYTFDYTRAVVGDFTGRQMVGYCEIRTTSPDVKFTIGTHELSVDSNDKWRYYKIPFNGGVDPEIVISNAVSGTDIVRVDNCFLGVSDNETQDIEVISDWQSYTPSNTQGFGTITDNDLLYRRVGDTLHISGKFRAGTTTATEAQLGLPDGLVISSKVASVQSGGTWFRQITSANNGGSVIITGGDSFINFGANGIFNSTALNPMNIVNGSTMLSSTNLATLNVEVPIEGWSSASSTIATQNTTLQKEIKYLSSDFTTDGVTVPDLTVDNLIIGNTYKAITNMKVNLAPSEFGQIYMVHDGSNVGRCSLDGIEGAMVSCISRDFKATTDTITFLYDRAASVSNILQGNGTDTETHILVEQQPVNLTIIGSFEQIEEVNVALDATTANEFNFKTDASGNPIVRDDEFDIINGNCVQSNATYDVMRCTYNVGIFTVPPTITVTPNTSTNPSSLHTCSLEIFANNTASEFYYSCKDGAGVYTPTPVNITVSKAGVDINKNLAGVIIQASESHDLIVNEVLESIASDDLIYISAKSNGSQPITSGSTDVTFNEEVDNKNMWSSDKVFQPTYDTNVVFSGSVYVAAGSSDFNIRLYEGVTFIKSCGYTNANARSVIFTCEQAVTAGNDYSIRLNKSLTLDPDARLHHLTIQELPTQEAIVANILADSGMIEKCQTKTLSTDVVGVGNIGDWASTLEVGKKYSIDIRAELASSGTGNQYLEFQIVNGVDIQETRWKLNSSPTLVNDNMIIPNRIFTASNTVLNINVSTKSTGAKIVSGAADSYMTLCELPETTIEGSF